MRDLFELIQFRLDDFDSLTIIVDFLALYSIQMDYRKELKMIFDKALHEEKFIFKMIAFTSEENKKNCEDLFKELGIEKNAVATQFKQVVENIF
mmetsp:Transcript_9817/g.8379  ORF Transcript_9817/g.8379 Transcript_9817/m.8379 type:complete len:94 (+) Transcript_9817:1069-1350(+)